MAMNSDDWLKAKARVFVDRLSEVLVTAAPLCVKARCYCRASQIWLFGQENVREKALPSRTPVPLKMTGQLTGRRPLA